MLNILTGHISRQQKGKVAGQNGQQEVSLDSKYGDARTPNGSREASLSRYEKDSTELQELT